MNSKLITKLICLVIFVFMTLYLFIKNLDRQTDNDKTTLTTVNETVENNFANQIKNATLTIIEENHIYEVTSSNIQELNKSEYALKDVTVTDKFPGNEINLTIFSLKAIYNRDKKIIEMKEEVVLKQQDMQAFTTESTFDLSKKIITGSGDTKIVSSKGDIFAKGFEFDIEKRDIKFNGRVSSKFILKQ